MDMINTDYLIIRLFILKIGKGKEESYKIAYGVVTPTANKMTKAVYTAFTNFGSFGKKCALGTIMFASDSDIIISIYNDLLKGVSVKTAFTKWDINTDNMNYDVTYSQDCSISPWLVEHLTICQINYTRTAYLLNQKNLFDNSGIEETRVSEALVILTNKLAERTHIANDVMQERLGNLEIIVAPARDANGRTLVQCKLKKSESFVQTVKVLSELASKYDTIATNVRLIVGDKIVVDQLKTFQTSGSDIDFSFESTYPVSSSEIRIWGIKGSESLIIHQATYYFIQRINVNMGVVGSSIDAHTDWLDKIRNNANKKQKNIVDKARKIEHRSSEDFTIEDSAHPLPLWAKPKKRAQPLVKSNDEYFTKGWDNTTNENGRLCFLEWFKRKANGSIDVFMQDPYFEDVALYFLASADIESRYTVLTQTHLKTNSDGTNAVVPEGETSERSKIIKKCILQNPTLFRGMKLVIKDIPVADNKLHDRYVVFKYPSGQIEAYTLSNSIQGSTIKQPLLITQIGDNAFLKLEKHLNEILDSNNLDTIYDYQAQNHIPSKDVIEIADAGFYDWVKGQLRTVLKGDIKHILDDAIEWNKASKIATLGYCLANIADDKSNKIINEAAKIIETDERWINTLKDFVLDKHYSKFPVGFIGCAHRGSSFHAPSYLLDQRYENIVSCNNFYYIEYADMEGETYRVWGQYFACKMLVKVAPNEAIDVLKQLRMTLVQIKSDKQVTPVYKITNMLLNAIFAQVAYSNQSGIMEQMLSDGEYWCRALGALILLWYSRNEKFSVSKWLTKIKDEKELKQICLTACSMQSEIANISVFYNQLIEIYERASDKSIVVEDLLNFLEGPNVFGYKMHFVEKVFKKLIKKGLLSEKEMCSAVDEGLYDKSLSEETAISMRGILPRVLYFLGGDTSKLEEKANKTIKNFISDCQSTVAPCDDGIFKIGRKMINLRNLLRDLLSIYSDYAQTKPSSIVSLLTEVDGELDKRGLQDVKVRFE